MKTNFLNNSDKTGFIALNQDDSIIHFKSGTIFPNKNVLNAVLERNNVIKFSYGFMVDNSLVVSGSEFVDTENLIKFITDDTINFATPQINEKIVSVGYFSFGWDPTERIEDKEVGKKISKENNRMINNSISYLIRRGELLPRTKDKNNYSTNRIPGSTIRMRTFRLCELIKINELRKMTGLKCLPFDKDLDRWKSIYFVFSIDTNDPYDNKDLNEEMVNITLSNIDSYITDKYFKSRIDEGDSDAVISINKIKIKNEILL